MRENASHFFPKGKNGLDPEQLADWLAGATHLAGAIGRRLSDFWPARFLRYKFRKLC
jgi:hypothetical protein